MYYHNCLFDNASAFFIISKNYGIHASEICETLSTYASGCNIILFAPPYQDSNNRRSVTFNDVAEYFDQNGQRIDRDGHTLDTDGAQVRNSLDVKMLNCHRRHHKARYYRDWSCSFPDQQAFDWNMQILSFTIPDQPAFEFLVSGTAGLGVVRFRTSQHSGS